MFNFFSIFLLFLCIVNTPYTITSYNIRRKTVITFIDYLPLRVIFVFIMKFKSQHKKINDTRPNLIELWKQIKWELSESYTF